MCNSLNYIVSELYNRGVFSSDCSDYLYNWIYRL